MPPVNATRLRDRRDELDLTNTELARRVGTSQGYVENILCGADAPSKRVIYRLSRVLDLPVDEIEAGRRTPQGDPSEPPVQPPNAPTHPPRRQDHEPGKTSPQRVTSSARGTAA
ncbi:helix-turn-helix transcriptional regulator [Saccharopolyspora sp. K220]|uniref:helix-turn-helix domain-containing protein n=1 Tax=Saccharopolyspora soli TaxID=2926618 RepID=UPI001F5AA540|nr:helix-turn-helix transcriptional regulator [Saccharopolyspora soli]MCI2421473.1 helix-turn-helix transcriptional regulator [Saccharopolyspora soli]